MKKACFVIPHFGKFNNYFQLFLNSCEKNPDFNWLILTDDKTEYKYPENVKVAYTTLDVIRTKINDRLGFDVALDRPYKLCDFKPAYGYIFSDYLGDYTFWGHCDTDLIWGKISHFISEVDWREFDKIGILGHCTLYRNVPEVNSLFMSTERYKSVYCNRDNCIFDEDFKDSINNIFLNCGKRVDMRSREAGIYTKSSNFKITRHNDDYSKYLVEPKKNAVFVWQNGVLLRYIKDKNGVSSEEYMYIHLQSRSMAVKTENAEVFKIIPNAFEDLEVNEMNEYTFDCIKVKNLNLHYFKLRSRNLMIKMRKYLRRLGRV